MPVTEIQTRLADPATAESIALVDAMVGEIDSVYADREGTVRSVSANPEEMSPPGGAFVILESDGRAIGCGGLKRIEQAICEIKRMYVEPGARSGGLGAVLLRALEDRARELGYAWARLDTGDRQPTAKRLYEAAGYREIPDYNGNTMARHWYEREL